MEERLDILKEGGRKEVLEAIEEVPKVAPRAQESVILTLTLGRFTIAAAGDWLCGLSRDDTSADRTDNEVNMVPV
ncbi:hypothetical protein N7526_009028 [Penicillium atrosanguineum]|nr:hypothetical protein N7526_009028 [Penicillium atrosanguineum]